MKKVECRVCRNRISGERNRGERAGIGIEFLYDAACRDIDPMRGWINRDLRDPADCRRTQERVGVAIDGIYEIEALRSAVNTIQQWIDGHINRTECRTDVADGGPGGCIVDVDLRV